MGRSRYGDYYSRTRRSCPPGMKQYLCVRENECILSKRIPEAHITTFTYGEAFSMGEVEVSFHPAGHILGSSQIKIQYQDEIWVFTGDFKRERSGCKIRKGPVGPCSFGKWY